MELVIKDLWVEVAGNIIIKGLNLKIKEGEVHAIMGPNGAGKTTLASVIMGHPKYKIIKGEITFDGKDLLAMTVDERARSGLFIAMQQPNEIPGITNADFIRSALQARQTEKVSLFKFIKDMDKAVADLKMNPDLPHRYINEGFSGGEKKRNEILQMKMLKPKLAILDEIDSGLDVDALKTVGENVNAMHTAGHAFLVITHYERLLDFIATDYVHVMLDGRIVKTDGAELIKKIDLEGYDWIRKELGIIEDLGKPRNIVLNNCAVKDRVKK